ncbi:MAG: hypothetical protein FJY85_10485, partial [Deltaproteobacteria bacterium]|nr:hypothetical protein [Deltaproteobacteria bacterium]
TKRIRKQTGREISDVARAAEGYDIAHVIHEASRHLKEVPTNMTELIQRIEQIEIEGPQGKIRFDKNHESVVEVRVAEWEISKGTLQHKIVAELGPCSSLDFGCGRVGFPKKPVTEPEDDSGADIDQE